MTVYAELLKLTLADERRTQPLDELVAEALGRREALLHHGDGATRLAASLAYDATLVRLCEELGIAHDLTGESAGPQARRRAEESLALHLPRMEAPLR